MKFCGSFPHLPSSAATGLQEGGADSSNLPLMPVSLNRRRSVSPHGLVMPLCGDVGELAFFFPAAELQALGRQGLCWPIPPSSVASPGLIRDRCSEKGGQVLRECGQV